MSAPVESKAESITTTPSPRPRPARDGVILLPRKGRRQRGDELGKTDLPPLGSRLDGKVEMHPMFGDFGGASIGCG